MSDLQGVYRRNAARFECARDMGRRERGRLERLRALLPAGGRVPDFAAEGPGRRGHSVWLAKKG